MTGISIPVQVDHIYLEAFGLLAERGIRYSVLKGTLKLGDALDGSGDLDLLVSPTDHSKAICALLDAGFKPARDPVAGNEPSQHHLFRPLNSGGWAHIHLHSSVVCDEQLRTELMLPSMTEPYLARTEDVQGWRLPVASAEYAHLLIKVFIRFASLPDLVLAVTGQWRPWQEIAAVRPRADIEETWAVMSESGLAMPKALLIECHQALASGRVSSRTVWLGWRVRRRLSEHRVDTRAGRWGDYLRHLFRKTFMGGRRRVSEFGGMIVAIVGPDAVGKSTLVEGLADRFGDAFQVVVHHGGKPRPTVKTLPLRMARLLWRLMNRADSGMEKEPRTRFGSPSLPEALNAWAVAEARRASVARALRSAARGALVLFDRYPSQSPGGMDGPRLETLRSSPGLAGALSRREFVLYEQLTPPDLVIRLTASVSTLVERDLGRGSPDGEAYLHQRSTPEAGWTMAVPHREVEIASEVGEKQVQDRAVDEIWRIF